MQEAGSSLTSRGVVTGSLVGSVMTLAILGLMFFLLLRRCRPARKGGEREENPDEKGLRHAGIAPLHCSHPARSPLFFRHLSCEHIENAFQVKKLETSLSPLRTEDSTYRPQQRTGKPFRSLFTSVQRCSNSSHGLSPSEEEEEDVHRCHDQACSSRPGPSDIVSDRPVTDIFSENPFVDTIPALHTASGSSSPSPYSSHRDDLPQGRRYAFRTSKKVAWFARKSLEPGLQLLGDTSCSHSPAKLGAAHGRHTSSQVHICLDNAWDSSSQSSISSQTGEGKQTNNYQNSVSDILPSPPRVRLARRGLAVEDSAYLTVGAASCANTIADRSDSGSMLSHATSVASGRARSGVSDPFYLDRPEVLSYGEQRSSCETGRFWGKGHGESHSSLGW